MTLIVLNDYFYYYYTVYISIVLLIVSWVSKHHNMSYGTVILYRNSFLNKRRCSISSTLGRRIELKYVRVK